MFEGLFGKRDSEDEYERQRLWKESRDEIQHDEKNANSNFYSVLIHFTPQASYIYLIENDIFEVQAGVAFIDSDLQIVGSFVCQNELASLEEVEDFLIDYQLINPIRLNYY
ncbi:hypothetical protein [Paenibacillus sp. Marseille-Q4541]|uniref:hypothetical protein n=1 Tax=Paenibacillus sp. Marseille-Q4541 TaxID=2831522 RepID=UPI001BA81749|nr:hypothetical protein [Paenibacillus sp. Marseille-Q4541]